MTDLSLGVKIGRAIAKLQELNERELFELTTAPESIRQRFEQAREKLLEKLEPAVRKAALAALEAADDEPVSE